MKVLGIAHDLWISSAALVVGGKVEAAVAEERLNRQKKYKGFPDLSIDKCFKIAGVKLEDIDMVVSGWNPVWHLESLHPRYSSTSRWRPEYLYSIPNYLLQKLDTFPFGVVEERFQGLEAKLYHIDHHIAHAANAFYLSPFDVSAVLCLDGQGERVTSFLGVADTDGIKKMGEVHYPHSLGLFYGMITQYLGFKPDSDEWKVMALSSYGSEKNNLSYSVLKNMIFLKSNGEFRLDLNMCGYHQPDVFGGRYYTKDFEKIIGISPRKASEDLTIEHYNLAWAVQKVFEETVINMLSKLREKTGMNNLVLSGGCFMNSVCNGKIEDMTGFKDIFISSCPDDSGISVGAALWGYYSKKKDAKRKKHSHNYWGPEYNRDIEEVLKKYKIKYEKISNASQKAAELLNEGKIIGWFQGKMEFGQRALGNRSILANPCNISTKDKVNLAVKYRESFRPFAPAILEDKVNEYFVINRNVKVPFMEKVLPFKESVKEKVPAVVHEDGTGRLQTVNQDDNPVYYDLIKAFFRLTGIPLILNTSFNLNGEPIVCTPSDALRTFYSCGLDCLILGDFLVQK